MAEQVRIDIVAEDKASKPIDKVADKVDDLEHAKPKVTVDADTKSAERDMADLLAKADKLSAAPATLLLKSNASTISADIKSLIGDIDKLDADDPTVSIKSDQINTLQGDLDQIDAKLKDINGTPVDIDTKPAVKGIDDVGKSADSSKSVLANMIGNSTQDLGALGGVAGSAGVAIGQMGEYMADAASEGEGLGSVVQSFGKVAVPIAALTLAMQALSDVAGRFGDSQKRTASSIKVFSDALGAGESAVDAYKDSVKAADGVILDITRNQSALTNTVSELNSHWYTTGIGVHVLTDLLHGADAETKNITSTLNKAGISLDQFADASTKGTAAYDQMAAALTHTNLSTDEQNDILTKLKNNQDDAAVAAKNHTEVQKLLGGATQDTAKHVQTLDEAYAAAALGNEQFVAAQQEGADALERINGLLRDEAAALNDQVDAATDAADAQLAENDALIAYQKVLKDAKASTDDQRDAAIALAKAHVTTAEAQARARGETITATGKLDEQNAALLNTAATARGPARSAILDYIGSLNQIPPDKLTEIKAAINAGDLALAASLLNGASAPRTAAIKADADNAALAQTDRDLDAVANKERTARIKVLASTGSALGAGSIISGGPRSVDPGPAPAPAPTIGVVNMALPTGWRGDPLAAAHESVRRHGRYYRAAG